MGVEGKLYTVIFHENFACFCSNQDPNLSFVCVLEIHWIKMVVTWYKREHEGEDMVALHDHDIVDALRNCVLLNFFRISNIIQ